MQTTNNTAVTHAVFPTYYTQAEHKKRAKSALLSIINAAGGTWCVNQHQLPARCEGLLRDLAQEGRVNLSATGQGEIVCHSVPAS